MVSQGPRLHFFFCSAKFAVSGLIAWSLRYSAGVHQLRQLRRSAWNLALFGAGPSPASAACFGASRQGLRTTSSSSLVSGSSSASSSAASGALSLELGSSGTARAGGEIGAGGSRNSLWIALPVARGCNTSGSGSPADRQTRPQACSARRCGELLLRQSPAPLPTGSAAVPAGGSAAAPRRRSTTHKFEQKRDCAFASESKASETGSPCPCARWGPLKVGRLGQRVLEKLVWRFRCSGGCRRCGNFTSHAPAHLVPDRGL